MKVLLDNGHGENTPGKRSPDGLFREYIYARFLTREIAKRLKICGIDAECIVPESEDIPLRERVSRVNKICKEKGANNVILVSVHCNASKNGEWGTARGWSAYTSKGETKSDKLATMLYVEAGRNFSGQTIRRDFSDKDPDWEEDFTILSQTACAAVLTENFFMDNEQDLAYLVSEEGREAILNVHVNGIVEYVKANGKH